MKYVVFSKSFRGRVDEKGVVLFELKGLERILTGSTKKRLNENE